MCRLSRTFSYPSCMISRVLVTYLSCVSSSSNLSTGISDSDLSDPDFPAYAASPAIPATATTPVYKTEDMAPARNSGQCLGDSAHVLILCSNMTVICWLTGLFGALPCGSRCTEAEKVFGFKDVCSTPYPLVFCMHSNWWKEGIAFACVVCLTIGVPRQQPSPQTRGTLYFLYM